MAEKVIIIGSGPAGWSAAIYAARAELKPLRVRRGDHRREPPRRHAAAGATRAHDRGRKLRRLSRPAICSTFSKRRSTPERVQYMNIHEGKHAVTGPELMELMRQQAINFGTRIVTDDVVEVDLQRRPFVVRTLEGNTHEAHALIIATGARANYLGLPSEEAYKNRGVSACAVCDGALPRFRNKPLVVVGGGDSAVEEATYPHQVRLEGPHGPPPRQAAGQHDHAGAGAQRIRRSRWSGTTRSTKCSATTRTASPACG